LPRQDQENGRIKDYEIYLSDDMNNWGTPVLTGAFENSTKRQSVDISSPKSGQFFKLKALSEVNGNAWSTAAELSLVGCIESATGVNDNLSTEISAYPIPTKGMVRLFLPSKHIDEEIGCVIYSISGQCMDAGRLMSHSGELSLDLNNYRSGVYIVQLKDNKGVKYNIKVVKE